jgi:hypothetical protein
MPLLEGKQLARNGADMFFISGVDAIAPPPGLFIQVWPTGERPASQEVVLDEPERPFDASGAVGIATLVGHKAEVKAFGKGSHLGHGNHLPSRSSQHHHVGVVDHDALRAAPEIPQRFGEKDFAIEALKRCVALKEQHARVAQHGRSGLYFAFLPREFQFVGRSIVLQFLAGQEVVLPYGLLRRLGEAMPAAEGGQGLVGEHRPTGGQLFMDPHKIPFAARQQLQDLLPIGFGFLRTLQHRHLRGIGTKHLADS